MPSRPPPSSPPIHHVHHRHLLLPLLTVTITLAFISLLSFLIFLYRKLSYNRTTPFDHHHSSATATPTTTPTTPTTATNTKKNNNNRFSYSAIRRATERKKRKIINSSLTRSIDWWLDGLGGEIRSGRRNSQDWGSTCGGDVPKSGGISSTPSMRGTVCYVAPEYGGGGQLSEKCDVYSFGVLVLVLISGRRPLQVTASPMSEFERANLISWARQLARNGKLLDLVDQSIHSLDKEEALLCITIALLCLQRTPGKRPTMKEIVGILLGEAEPPHLPFEFSPSPPSNFPFKSRKKAR
ncbi:hypothetical protein PRUPE_2G149500 [Prunus persica]|uniref:Protein kinase domain-containing protein n=1 Tax=Prunus persica TaxID=3760 RepID=A0A251QG01_PRUPE|nr:hypothetical protein PRUPE_2G149500 [Prunus persica]